MPVEVDLNTNDGGFQSKGEGQELAVQRILWYLYYPYAPMGPIDDPGLSPKALLEVIDHHKVYTFSKFWDRLIVDKSDTQRAKFGSILALHRAGPSPIGPDDGMTYYGSQSPLKFSWEGNLCGPYGVQYELRFFDDTFTTLIHQVCGLKNVSSYTLEADDEKALFGANENRTIRWLVISKVLGEPVSGDYYGRSSRLVNLSHRR